MLQQMHRGVSPAADLSVRSRPTTRNRLLAALSPEVLKQLWPSLVRVELNAGQPLHAPGEPIAFVFFPESSCVSVLAGSEDDVMEVGVIGRDGMLGLAVLLGAECDDLEAIVQTPGTALRIGAPGFREMLEALPALRAFLLRYALAHYGEVARTAACNGRHSIRQRLARTLLMADDRADGGTFTMTQELLARILGVRRPGVTIAASLLQEAGLIRYSVGRMEVTDRDGLESVACHCYGIGQDASERLLGPPLGASAPDRG